MPSISSRVRATFSAVLAACCLAAPASASAMDWTSIPMPLSTFSSSHVPSATTDPTGATFMRTGYEAISVRPAGGTFGAPVTAPQYGPFFANSGVSTWMTLTSPAYHLTLTRRSAGATGTFGTTVDTGVGSPGSLAVGANGREILAYGPAAPVLNFSGDSTTLAVRTRGAGESAVTEETIPGSPQVQRALGVYVQAGAAVDADGSAFIAFLAQDGSVQTTTRTEAGVWSAPTVLRTPAPGQPIYAIRVDSNALGDAVVSWTEVGPGAQNVQPVQVRFALRPHDGAVGAQTLAKDQTGARLVDAAMTSDGVALLGVTAPTMMGQPSAWVLRAAGAVTEFTSSQMEAVDVDIAASRAGGHVAIGWEIFGGTHSPSEPEDNNHVFAQIGTSAFVGGLDRLPQLDGPEKSVSPRLAVSDTGHGFAVWTGSSPAGGGTSYAYGAVFEDCTAGCGSTTTPPIPGGGGGDGGGGGGGGGGNTTTTPPATDPVSLTFGILVNVANPKTLTIANSGNVGATSITFATTCKSTNTKPCQVYIDGAATGSYNAGRSKAKPKIVKFTLKLKRVTAKVQPGKSANLKLVITKAQMKTILAALRAGGKVNVKATPGVDKLKGSVKTVPIKLAKKKK